MRRPTPQREPHTHTHTREDCTEPCASCPPESRHYRMRTPQRAQQSRNSHGAHPEAWCQPSYRKIPRERDKRNSGVSSDRKRQTAANRDLTRLAHTRESITKIEAMYVVHKQKTVFFRPAMSYRTEEEPGESDPNRSQFLQF